METARITGVLWALVLLTTLFSFSLPAHAKYGAGTGEPNDPYLIYTAGQMNEIGLNELDWDKHFKLMSDIDLFAYKGTAFNIIGKYAPGGGRGGPKGEYKPFTGVFDGNGHVISNFTYDCNGISEVALFRSIDSSDAEIRDLRLIDPNVCAVGGLSVGSLIGYLNNGTITNCYVEGGSVEGHNSIGGIVGRYWEGTIAHCYSSGNVRGNEGVGGVVGSNWYGKIRNCHFSGSAFGSYKVGGLVGVDFAGIVTHCYSKGSINGTEYIGGLFNGTVSVISVPDNRQLKRYTRQVQENNGFNEAASILGKKQRDVKPQPIPRRVGEPSLIKHVIYIIKENFPSFIIN